MNHCESYEPLLDAFTEGDLFMEDMVWVQQHLNNCPDCQAYVEDLLAIRAAFPTVEETEVPAGFTASVMAAVAATPQATAPQAAASKSAAKPTAKSAGKNTPWAKVLSGLAACCAIVLLAQGGLKMASGGSAAPQEAAPRAEEAPAEAPMEMYYTTADSITEEAAAEAEAPAPEAKSSLPETEVMPEVEAAPPVNDVIHDGSVSVEHTAGGTERTDAPYRIVITVDAAYVGDALDGHTPVAETSGSSDHPGPTAEYELTMAEYNALLARWGDKGEMPAEEVFNTDSETVLVIVRQ